ncbi:SANT/Myb-like DNA-binding domain-containing protein [Aspergillus chevalieri]|uniref:Myb-like domain-containing protein n=1 Tax=Aspergillus chevalieri TaxID=182096 RepID=A0A7R7ZKX4_ASPCH|nr:uncharacterized protein ACHE_30227A [Aspergillus chevalieri]BCR86240.1 hypothetical protein ACHE_30227A [Aspergillus chevalieri]
MPVFVVDGKQYKVPFKTLFKGNKTICDQIIADKRASTVLPEVTLEQATATRASNTASTNDQTDQCYRFWTAREDRLLRELVAFRVPWSRISISLGNRPIEDVKKRWDYLRSGKAQSVEVGVDGAFSTDGIPVGNPHLKKFARTTQPEPKPERHVSFADPLVTAGDTDDEEENGASHPPKTKKVYYVDEEFSLEDVVMLHNIAAKWERDRWLAISTRFNDITQRKITPEQAKSVVDN